jgi:hypothetical protein
MKTYPQVRIKNTHTGFSSWENIEMLSNLAAWHGPEKIHANLNGMS